MGSFGAADSAQGIGMIRLTSEASRHPGKKPRWPKLGGRQHTACTRVFAINIERTTHYQGCEQRPFNYAPQLTRTKLQKRIKKSRVCYDSLFELLRRGDYPAQFHFFSTITARLEYTAVKLAPQGNSVRKLPRRVRMQGNYPAS